MDNIAYKGNEPFAFISYSHADRIKVEMLLRMIYKRGRKFWYDAGIEYSSNWEDTINERLQSSSMFILFLSNGVEQRPEVIRELRMAMKKREETDGAYKIFVILLQQVSVTHLFRDFPDILGLLSCIQYVPMSKYGGDTIAFRELLVSDEIWRYCSADGEIESSETELSSLSDIKENTDYIYNYANPQVKSIGHMKFVPVSIGETDPHAVYLLCLDNQWCPPSYYRDERFRSEGFGSRELEQKRCDMQRNEVITALIHNRQVIINRASFFNSEALKQWFVSGENDDSSAFCRPLGNGSLVVFLMTERSPAPEELPSFDVDPEQYALWREMCSKNIVYCIRMSWEGIVFDSENDEDNKGTAAKDNDETNSSEMTRKISQKMKELFLTTANDKYRLEAFEKAMDIPEDKVADFEAIWKKIRDKAIAAEDERPGSYRRNSFYLDMLVKEGSKVPMCLLDYSKPFVCELKQIVDYHYMVNLPYALGIKPMSSYNIGLSNYSMYERRSREHLRQITADELYCSIVSFIPDFLKDTYFCGGEGVSLSDAAHIRDFDEWIGYMEALDASRKRARMNEIDFHDVEVVWRRYSRLMKKCAGQLKTLEFARVPGSLSVIYTFGNYELISVYTAGSDKVKIRKGEARFLTSKRNENLTIDFACGDVLEYPYSENCFVERLGLFEGVMLQACDETYEKTLGAIIAGMKGFTEV